MPADDPGHAKGKAKMLAARLRAIREETFSDDGIPGLARRLGVPEGTWRSYEAGVAMSATTLLDFLEATRAEPGWLLRGEGPRYRAGPMAVATLATSCRN